MAIEKRTVLITGCSDGGLGAALAVAFHNANLHVYATARNTSKMKGLESLGIEILALDVQSDTSIADCVAKTSSLDILINNAGAGYNMPISDMSIAEAKKLFDLNVWANISVTQAFLPLLLKSKGIIVNHTSVASVFGLPFQGPYSASKAAAAMLSECLRLELEPFGVTVVDLKTGSVSSNFFNNLNEVKETALPKDSIYQPAKEAVERSIRGELFAEISMPTHQWAVSVVKDLLRNKPPATIWRGKNASQVWMATFLPHGLLDGTSKKMTGLDVVERMVRE